MGRSLTHILILLISQIHTWKVRGDQFREKITDQNKDKKKKVANKKDTTSRGLKYINPSQRNHSSIYE
jgi:hypothetical protein